MVECQVVPIVSIHNHVIMNKKDRALLISLIHERIQVLENLSNHTPSPQNRPLPTDEPTAAIDMALTEQARQELGRLKRQLIWLSSDEAGLCRQCGCEIPLERLKVILTTCLCVNCSRSNLHKANTLTVTDL